MSEIDTISDIFSQFGGPENYLRWLHTTHGMTREEQLRHLDALIRRLRDEQEAADKELAQLKAKSDKAAARAARAQASMEASKAICRCARAAGLDIAKITMGEAINRLATVAEASAIAAYMDDVETENAPIEDQSIEARDDNTVTADRTATEGRHGEA